MKDLKEIEKYLDDIIKNTEVLGFELDEDETDIDEAIKDLEEEEKKENEEEEKQEEMVEK